jgi:uncharacterized protein YegP (UPF0339 family)
MERSNSIDTRFELYQNDNGEFRGKLVRADGSTIIDARESYNARPRPSQDSAEETRKPGAFE